MDNAGAFGSSGATGEFQLMTFIKKPQVILRFLGWVSKHQIISSSALFGWEC